MNKAKSIEASLHKLAASFARSTSNLGLAPISLERRRELTARIKAKPEVIRSTLAAANAHPGLLGDNLDPRAIAADVDFVEAAEAALGVLEASLRAVADEILIRKARAAQASIAIRRTLEAATHTEGGAGLVLTLSTMKQKRRRPRKPLAEAPASPPPAELTAQGTGPRLNAVS